MRLATRGDLSRIVEIYNSTVASRMVTADTEEVDVSSRVAWFESHTPGRHPLMVHEIGGRVAAWVGYEAFYGRPAYDATAEISIYVAREHRGLGLGRALLREALDMAPGLGIRKVVAFVFAHNEPSLRLFRSQGFRDWGLLPDVAEMDGREYGLSILGRRVGDGAALREGMKGAGTPMVAAIDHLVFTVRDVEATCAFYARVLGMEVVEFGGGRKALRFGGQKINLHRLGAEFEPRAAAPAPGSQDICLLAVVPLAEVLRRLEACGVAVEEGPVRRTGAVGPIESVYFRDPDGNLVEVSTHA